MDSVDDEEADSGWLNETEYSKVVSLTSLVSVDLLIFDGEGRVLVGRRTNEPARGMWFTPGGRVKKFEPIGDAVRRISAWEVGEAPRTDPRLHGVYRHMYETSRFVEPGEGSASWRTGTDYVNFAYTLTLADHYSEAMRHATKLLPCEQHSAFRWLSPEEALRDPEVDPHVKCYFHPHAWNRIA